MKVKWRRLRPQVCNYGYFSKHKKLTICLGVTIFGYVVCAQWPNSSQGEVNQGEPISTIHSRGEDWALVEIDHVGMRCNTFHVPGDKKPQRVTGYVKTADLTSCEVWVCAGVSGVQVGFMKRHPASVIMSKSLFAVRSISLERPLGKFCLKGLPL